MKKASVNKLPYCSVSQHVYTIQNLVCASKGSCSILDVQEIFQSNLLFCRFHYTDLFPRVGVASFLDNFI
jgi:hypothetical protein